MLAKPHVVVPYDPDWPAQFEAEAALLEPALGPWLEGGIHHIGSTSVPGLASKPIIDLIAGVRDLEGARAAFGPLGVLGYRYQQHRPEAHSLHKPGTDNWWEETHHLHLTEPGSDLWRERLAFRDALRADPALVAEYASWKYEHAVTSRQPFPYRGDKGPFVARVLAEAGIELRPDAQRLTARALEDRLRAR